MDLDFDWSGTTMIALLKIIAIDIILSGDNAIVIAMATRKLPDKQRNQAILWGTLGAVILRILFAAIIVYLLKIPFVHLLGGLLLLWIAYKVLVDHEEETKIKSENSLIKAIGTIITADVVMSLDNVVAIAGASDGHIALIALGVLISIPVMIFGSKIIVYVMKKYQWIAYLGSGILAWTAGDMILKDPNFLKITHLEHGAIMYVMTVFITVFILLLGYLKNKSEERHSV